MTLTEARAVARIIGTADDGCSVYVSNLVMRLNEARLDFQFEDTGKDLYARRPEWYPEGGRENAGIYVRVVQR